MTSPVICSAEYIRYFIKNLESKFPFPFQWVDKYTLEGLDVYEEWLDEQKKAVQKKRLVRKNYLEVNNFRDNDEDDM
jgi:hypothetical protein